MIQFDNNNLLQFINPNKIARTKQNYKTTLRGTEKEIRNDVKCHIVTIEAKRDTTSLVESDAFSANLICAAANNSYTDL